MIRKQLLLAGIVIALVAMFASPAMANHIDSASVTPTCTSVTLTVSGGDLTDTGVTFVVNYEIIITPSGGGAAVQDITGSLNLSPDASGNASSTITNTFASLAAGSYNVSGSATLTEVDSSGNVTTLNTLPLSSSGTFTCGGTTGGGKSFSIGPSSMEGDLHIAPGDWISGGYNFKFTNGSHAATMYSVTATVTVPVTCPDNSIQNIIIPLGAPGQLNGGGVSTFTYSIPAGDTSNHATNNQNSILTWEGAVQAPASLCGGQVGRNQKGAIFNTTVSQSPQVGLVDWQFHYRDPNAKGKGNVNCTDASDPRRNDAATCGASWSPTLRDP
jgi:hypothetical protein